MFMQLPTQQLANYNPNPAQCLFSQGLPAKNDIHIFKRQEKNQKKKNSFLTAK